MRESVTYLYTHYHSFRQDLPSYRSWTYPFPFGFDRSFRSRMPIGDQHFQPWLHLYLTEQNLRMCKAYNPSMLPAGCCSNFSPMIRRDILSSYWILHKIVTYTINILLQCIQIIMIVIFVHILIWNWNDSFNFKEYAFLLNYDQKYIKARNARNLTNHDIVDEYCVQFT